VRQGNMVTIRVVLVAEFLPFHSHAAGQACRENSTGVPTERRGNHCSRGDTGVGKETSKFHVVSYSMESPTVASRTRFWRLGILFAKVYFTARDERTVRTGKASYLYFHLVSLKAPNPWGETRPRTQVQPIPDLDLTSGGGRHSFNDARAG